MPVNILPVKKETYYCNIKEISKEKQDGTILVTELNDLEMTIKVTGKTIIKFCFEGYSHRLSRFNNICINGTLLVQFVMQKLKENE